MPKFDIDYTITRLDAQGEEVEVELTVSAEFYHGELHDWGVSPRIELTEDEESEIAGLLMEGYHERV